MSPELVALLMFVSLLTFIFVGVPMSFALGGIAVVTNLLLWGPDVLLNIVLNVFALIWNEVFVAIPLFIYMGLILERAGIADNLYEALYRWSGPVRGGLAMGTTVICAIFAAMSGVAAPATITMGLIALPSMLKRGYDKSLALGSIAGPGTLGILIPPSVPMIFLAMVTQQSAAKLFAAGLIPGLLLAGMFITYIGIKGILQPWSCPAHGEQFTLKEKIILSRAIILPALLILSVLGSIFFGIATPTEAAAVGCGGAFLCIFVRRRFTWQALKETTYNAFRITTLAFWITWGAGTFSATFTAAGGAFFVRDLMLGLEVSPIVIVIIFMLFILILGMFIDALPIILIVAPVAFPIIITLGFSPVWFGILFVLGIMMGLMTPPFGYQLFYLKAVVPPEITLTDIYRSIFPFLTVMIVCMGVLIAFPQIVLWFPNLLMALSK